MKRELDSVGIGLVGCGRISQDYLQALARLPFCRLVGVADVRPQVAESVAAQYGCRHHSGHEELLTESRPDAVIIAAPPDVHREIAGFFLENRVHVLCEKPIALSSREAMGLVETARAHDVLLMMASKFRYVDDVTKAKGILQSGILGDVVLYENVFCSKVDMRDRWNSNRAIAGGGVLTDNGTHSVDIARFLLGPIIKTQAEEGKRVQGLEVEDTCRLYIRTASDAMGAIDLSWSIHKERDSYIELFGPEGVLSIGWRCSKYRQSEKLKWIEFGTGYDKLGALSGQLRNFANSIRGLELPLIRPEAGVESIRVIEAAYRSMAVNKWVSVEGRESGAELAP